MSTANLISAGCTEAKAVSAMAQQFDQLHRAVSALEEESAMLRVRIEPVSRPVNALVEKAQTAPEEMLGPVASTIREMRKRIQAETGAIRCAREQLEI